MTDSAPDPRDASPDDGKVRKVPPLVWIILALLVVMVVIGVSQYGGSRVTPSGGSVPQPKAEEAYLPAPTIENPAPPAEAPAPG